MEREGYIVGGVTAAFVVAFVALMYWGITSDVERAERFMRECQQERKRYECEAMWRAGDSNTVAVPVVVAR